MNKVAASGIVYLTLPPLSTYTTADGWEWMGVFSPLRGAYRNTRTFWSSARTVKCFTPHIAFRRARKRLGKKIIRSERLGSTKISELKTGAAYGRPPTL